MRCTTMGLIVLAAALLLGGCAAMNTSVMETAETLDRGHVEVGAEYVTGLELSTTVFLEDDEETFDADGLAPAECYGLRVGYGVTDRLELNAKLWASIGGVGWKLYAKYALTDGTAGATWAVAPGVTRVTTDTDDDDGGSLEEYVASVSTLGFELPLIVTHRFNESVAVSGTVRYSLDAIDIAYPADSALQDLNDVYMLHRIGVVNGWTFTMGPLIFQPEIGVEMATQVNGEFGVVPVLAVGLGLEF
ncbi:MAG: hypothetical protein ABIG03_00060 [Candidatus Eisenbacteria bacterium]